MEYLELTKEIIYWGRIPNRLDIQISHCQKWERLYTQNGFNDEAKEYSKELEKLLEIKECIELLKENLK